MTGRVHSVETCGTVDGPGIRFVVFLQGCPLRCLYCHNPDTWDPAAGEEREVEELVDEIRAFRSYMRASGGGVTVSGGEPLLQAPFVAELFRACKAYGIHTALDTSGHCSLERAKPVLDQTDLVLLDLKSYTPDRYQTVTGVKPDHTLGMAEYLREQNIPMWVRFVQVPGLTDDPEEIGAMAEYLKDFPNIQRLEVIPFHKMGEYKWKQLGLSYTLADTPPAHRRDVDRTKEIFRQAGITVP